MTQIYSATKHWAKIVDEPKDRVDEEWEHCYQVWDKLNQSMVRHPDANFQNPFRILTDR
jgi:hypothetical protein